jgi:polygalacturonase
VLTLCAAAAVPLTLRAAPQTPGRSAAPAASVLSGTAAPAQDPWQRVPSILARIKPPAFPDRTFQLTEYAVARGGAPEWTGAFRAAIGACHAAGGGRVLVPPGEYLTGPIHLKSNVELHVSKGAVLSFAQDPAQYLPPVLTRYEGNDCYSYSPFIYARDQQNVAITGGGIIDGQANSSAWLEMDDRTADQEQLRAMADEGVPVEKRIFGRGRNLRPNLVQFYRCTGVLIEGVTLRNGPMWTVHPVLCKNVTVRGITIFSEVPNGDGVDPESCSDVLIKDCTFQTRDDAVVLKAGRNADGRRVPVPCENVVVQGCRVNGGLEDTRNGFAVGSEMSAGVRNVFFEDCVVSGRLRGISLKTNTRRGGFIEDIYFRNLRFHDLGGPVLLADLGFGSETGPHSVRVRNIELRRSTADGAGRLFKIEPARGVTLANGTIADGKFLNMRNQGRPEKLHETPGVSVLRCTVSGRGDGEGS